MKIYKFLLLVFFFFSGANSLFADNSIAYIDMQKLMSQSLAGKNVNEKIDIINKKNIKKFKETEKKFQEDEKILIGQRNILEKKVFDDKVKAFREKAAIYQKNKSDTVIKMNNQRLNAAKKIIDIVNPILAEYSTENSISFIMQKKYIIIGKTELDITDDIIKKLNLKVKKINLD